MDLIKINLEAPLKNASATFIVIFQYAVSIIPNSTKIRNRMSTQDEILCLSMIILVRIAISFTQSELYEYKISTEIGNIDLSIQVPTYKQYV